MITAIMPQFFSTDLAVTLAYYRDMLGFATQFAHGTPPFYAGVIRDGQAIFFRRLDGERPRDPDKDEEEYLDAYIRTGQIEALYAEYQAKGVVFARPLANMPWACREFVVKDGDGRLLCFGQPL
jgi:uncharacterized glyoxalase superfamily protein PhnB